MKVRESNFELLRIVAMLMIIFGHFFVHSNLLVESSGTLQIACRIILAIIIIHVNLFILISGYFGYKSKFKISKLLALNNATWFYTILITIIALIFLNISFTKLELLKNFLPIDFGTYWFIITYMLLYLISPILNTFINNSTKEKHLIVLIILFIVLSIIPTLTHGEVLDVVRGYSLYNFILLYLLGAYLSKYKIEYKTKYLLIIFISMCTLNILGYYLGCHLIDSTKNSLLNYLGISLRDGYITYSNPLVIVQATSFLLLFKKIKLKSKLINFIATNVFGVYLIHDNYILRDLYTKMPLSKTSLNVILIGILFTIIVFVLCTIIEILRKLLFKLIYNLKISNYLRPKYTKYFNKIEKHINE